MRLPLNLMFLTMLEFHFVVICFNFRPFLLVILPFGKLLISDWIFSLVWSSWIVTNNSTKKLNFEMCYFYCLGVVELHFHLLQLDVSVDCMNWKLDGMILRRILSYIFLVSWIVCSVVKCRKQKKRFSYFGAMWMLSKTSSLSIWNLFEVKVIRAKCYFVREFRCWPSGRTCHCLLVILHECVKAFDSNFWISKIFSFRRNLHRNFLLQVCHSAEVWNWVELYSDGILYGHESFT